MKHYITGGLSLVTVNGSTVQFPEAAQLDIRSKKFLSAQESNNGIIISFEIRFIHEKSFSTQSPQ